MNEFKDYILPPPLLEVPPDLELERPLLDLLLELLTLDLLLDEEDGLALLLGREDVRGRVVVGLDGREAGLAFPRGRVVDGLVALGRLTLGLDGRVAGLVALGLDGRALLEGLVALGLTVPLPLLDDGRAVPLSLEYTERLAVVRRPLSRKRVREAAMALEALFLLPLE